MATITAPMNPELELELELEQETTPTRAPVVVESVLPTDKLTKLQGSVLEDLAFARRELSEARVELATKGLGANPDTMVCGCDAAADFLRLAVGRTMGEHLDQYILEAQKQIVEAAKLLCAAIGQLKAVQETFEQADNEDIAQPTNYLKQEELLLSVAVTAEKVRKLMGGKG